MQLAASARNRKILFTLVAATMLCAAPLHAADETGYTIRSSVSEVRLAFAATDPRGSVVKTLRPADVAIADNGEIIRHFRSFHAASESPLDLVILIDASDSMRSQLQSEIDEVKSVVEGSTWGERDRISILSFGGLRPVQLCLRNCSTQTAQAKLTTLRASGATPLYDALFEGAEILKDGRDPEARPAMILFSDGVDTSSMNTIFDAVEAAQNRQAAIYCVNSRPRKSAPSGDMVLEQLAWSTGGLSFAPGQKVEEALRKVVEDLRGGYVLTYDLPEQTAGQHTVQVLPTSDARLRFRARLAYDERGSE